MSDRYSPMGHAATALCHDCGAVVYWDKDHDAFHARLDDALAVINALREGEK